MELHALYPKQDCMRDTVKDSLYCPPLFIADRVEYPDSGGTQVFYKDCALPKWGLPFPEAVKAIGISKRAGMLLVKNLGILKILTRRKSILIDYIKLCDNAMTGYYLKPEYMCPMAKQLNIFFNRLFYKLGIDPQLGIILTHIFEYDDAYRYFLQDLFDDFQISKATKVKTYLGLVQRIRERQVNSGATKFIPFLYLVCILILIPKYRNAIKYAFSFVDIDKFRMDMSDIYWTSIRDDYNFGGMTYENRRLIWMEMTTGKPVQYTI